MAGTQPEATSTQLAPQGAAAPTASVFDAPPPTSNGGASVFDAPGTGDAQQGQFAEKHPILQKGIDALPMAGGIAGGVIGGMATGGLGGEVPGAGLGAAFGNEVKNTFNAYMNRQQQPGITQKMMDDAMEGGKQAAYTLVGGLTGLGVQKIMGDPAADAIVNKIATLSSQPLAHLEHAATQAYQSVVKPMADAFFPKGTPLNTEQAGDAVKQLFTKDITQKFGTFVDSYSKLDAVAKATPLTDEARLDLSNRLREHAATKGGDNYAYVRKVADDVNAADNGAAFDDIIGQVKSKAGKAFADNEVNQGKFYTELAGKLSDFQDGQITKLAQRVTDGKATPQEIGAFNKLAQSQGAPQDANVESWMGTAKDYLKNRDANTKEYAKFRGFLSDVGEQTKVNPSGSGPMSFLKDIQDVPSEKLIERMFDPKNASALRAMQKETPEIYEQVTRTKMQQVLDRSKYDGEPGTLDVKSFRKNLDALPKSTLQHLVTDKEWGAINEFADNPVNDVLEHAKKNATKNFVGYMAKTVQAAGLATTQLTRSAGKILSAPGIKQGVGAGLMMPFIPKDTQQ